jgi:hypothetical protein
MVPSGHQFFLVLRDKSGLLHEEELDFNLLIHDTAFAGVTAGRLANDGRWEPVGIEPVWSGRQFDGVTVSVAGISRAYGPALFHDRAVEILCSKGLLGDDQNDRDRVSWNVERRNTTKGSSGNRTRASLRHRPYPLVVQAPIGDVPTRAGEQDDSVSLRVSSGLVTELCELSANSLDRERADFLVGRLVQVADGRAVAVVLTRIPAEADTGSSLVHFSFSPQTFQTAQRELECRGSSDVILGWHHNHPPPCGHQCLMTIPACGTDNVAFSMNDRIVHRSAFARPYLVALVSGKGTGRRADDPVLRAYGWRQGRICELGWSVF